MAYSFNEKKRIRNNFGSRESILTEPPNRIIHLGGNQKFNMAIRLII